MRPWVSPGYARMALNDGSRRLRTCARFWATPQPYKTRPGIILLRRLNSTHLRGAVQVAVVESTGTALCGYEQNNGRGPNIAMLPKRVSALVVPYYMHFAQCQRAAHQSGNTENVSGYALATTWLVLRWWASALCSYMRPMWAYGSRHISMNAPSKASNKLPMRFSPPAPPA